MRSGLLATAVMLAVGAFSASAPKLDASRLLEQGLSAVKARGARTTAALADSGVVESDLAKASAQGADVAALYGDFERQLQGMTPEERSMYKEMSPQIELITNPMVKKLLEGGGPSGAKARDVAGKGGSARLFGGLAGISLQLKAWALVMRTVYYPRYKSEILFLMWAAPLCLMAAAFAMLQLGQPSVAGLLGHAVFKFSSLALLFLSLAAVTAYMAFKVNLFFYMPWECWCAAVVFTFGGALVLRSVDMNYPFWNYTFTALLVPVLASGLMAVWSVVSRTGIS